MTALALVLPVLQVPTPDLSTEAVGADASAEVSASPISDGHVDANVTIPGVSVETPGIDVPSVSANVVAKPPSGEVEVQVHGLKAEEADGSSSITSGLAGAGATAVGTIGAGLGSLIAKVDEKADVNVPEAEVAGPAPYATVETTGSLPSVEEGTDVTLPIVDVDASLPSVTGELK